MRRTVLYISMSLDGCLARPDGDVSWLAGQDPDDPDPGTYPAFLSTAVSYTHLTLPTIRLV